MALDFSSAVEQELGLRQNIDHGDIQDTCVLIELEMLDQSPPSGVGPPTRLL